MAQQLLSDRIETTIISNLFFNEDFTRKALPFIQPEYFSNTDERILFSEIFKFVDGYKNLPTKDTILIELNNRKDLNEDQLKNLRQLVSNASNEEVDLQWLLDTTEKWCKDRAVHNAVLSGIKILDNKDQKRTPEAIPSILSDALAVSFDNHIGHDYIEDAQNRFEWYHTKENAQIDVRLTYKTGLDRYYGLLELGEEAGVFKKVSTRYEMPAGTKVFGKTINTEPEKYFTKEVLEKIDEFTKQKFTYGQDE